jgi:glycosyltransferase involved in cell wall biosynthesis
MTKPNELIFIQIASYRDPELVPTIQDMIYRAKHPENLTFGICWQHDETEPIDMFDKDPRFKIAKYHYSESQGLGWARAITNSLYTGEKYTLQIDSHHRFVDGWDKIVLDDFNQALKESSKPVITTYCAPFDPKAERSTWNPTPSLMSQYEFSADKLLMSMPWYIQDYKQRTKVIKARTISGHFYFTWGKFIEEVPYDPDIYFGGYTEETTLSLRAFTHGYDFYSPYRTVMWHEYTRNYRPKHWEDHGTESKTQKTSGERDIFARKKTRQLFGNEDNGIEMGIYGLGTERTLRDYEIYGGFDFKTCRIHDYTLKVNEPPNPQPWEDGFITNKFSVKVTWDINFFKNLNFEKPKFMTLGIQSKSGIELYRKDFTVEEQPDYLNFKINQFQTEIRSIDRPSSAVMYLFDEEKQWSPRYETPIHLTVL